MKWIQITLLETDDASADSVYVCRVPIKDSDPFPEALKNALLDATTVFSQSIAMDILHNVGAAS